MKEEFTKVSDTLIKGRITELKTITFFLERGYIVSVPEIPCQYDFLLDVNGKIYKIQVKTSRISSDGSYISFSICASSFYFIYRIIIFNNIWRIIMICIPLRIYIYLRS